MAAVFTTKVATWQHAEVSRDGSCLQQVVGLRKGSWDSESYNKTEPEPGNKHLKARILRE